MAFVDQVKIFVKAGKGGDGAVSFRHEKYIDMGGPFGGDGGHGGSVIMVVDEGLRTLMDFRYQRHFKAQVGGHGATKEMTGKSAEDLVIKVPQGTTITNTETGAVIGDLTEKGQRLVIAQGGRGGRGNIRFASSKNPAPEIAENGEPGEELDISLELKVLADVGLVGFPSVGKSTLLSVVTAAKPKVAAYHFTTLVPNLGMVRLGDGRDFSMADLPGLIEGASNGVGLGIQFLRHVERTKVILHLVEMDPENGRDPYEDYQVIRKELETYDEKVVSKPEIIVATKMDLPGSDERLAKFKEDLGDKEVFPISSLTHDGVFQLMSLAATELDKVESIVEPEISDATETKEYNFVDDSKKFEVVQVGEREFEIHGADLEKTVAMTNIRHNDGIMRLARKLKT